MALTTTSGSISAPLDTFDENYLVDMWDRECYRYWMDQANFRRIWGLFVFKQDGEAIMGLQDGEMLTAKKESRQSQEVTSTRALQLTNSTSRKQGDGNSKHFVLESRSIICIPM
jgi:hypothetical protein